MNNTQPHFREPSAERTLNRTWKAALQAALLLLTLIAILGQANRAQATNIVANSDFETLSAAASGGSSTMTASGGYICGRSTSSCVSNLASWTSTCKGSAGNLSCGTGGTVASIIYSGTNGSAFNGGIGLANTIANSPTGGKFIAIDGDSVYNASVSQTLSGLTIGATYILQFWQAAAQQKGTVGATTEWWDVSFGTGGTYLGTSLPGVSPTTNTAASTKMFNPDQGFTPWQKQTMYFRATTATATLRFLAKSDNNNMGLPPVVLLDGVFVEQVPEPGTFVLLGAGLIALAAVKQRKKKADPKP
jgi:PEP-CTERM motif